MASRRRTLDLPWGSVSYLEWSPSETPAASTVLLLHVGGLDSAWLSWGAFGSSLADAGHRVIAPDHPGYGHSPPSPWKASQERLVSYVGEIVDALRLERYAVGGLSLGGGMTIGHVLTRPEDVTGALLFGSYGLMNRQFEGLLSGPAHVLTWSMLHAGMLGAVMRAYGKNRKRMESSVRNIIRNPAQRTSELLDAIMAEAERGSGFAPFEQWQHDQFLWNRLRTNYTSQLQAFPRPALVIHGDHDTGVPVAYARLAADTIPDARLLIVPDAGHWVQRDRPEVVTPVVLDFLNELG